MQGPAAVHADHQEDSTHRLAAALQDTGAMAPPLRHEVQRVQLRQTQHAGVLLQATGKGGRGSIATLDRNRHCVAGSSALQPEPLFSAWCLI